MRTLAATVLAPLAVIPVLTLLFGPWAMTHGARSLAGILGPALVVAYSLTMLIGLPMHLTLVRQRFTRIRDYAVTGMLLGAVPVLGYVIVAIVFEARFDPALLAHAAMRNGEWGAIGVAVFGTCSAAVAVAFRAVAGSTASPS